MARKMNAQTDVTDGSNTVLHNVGDRAELMNNLFKQIFNTEQDIAALIEEHIDPLKQDKKKLWRTLKKDLDIEREDLELFYKLYKRDRLAAQYDEEVRDKIRDNCREIYAALQKGGQIDWLAAAGLGAEAPAVH